MIRNSINHPKCFNPVTGKTDILNDIDSINKSLDLLLNTSKGELFGDPNYGTNLMRFIYETNEVVLQDLVSSDIITAISKYEKRISVSEEDIHFKINKNTLKILINYNIRNNNTSNSYELELLKEGI